MTEAPPLTQAINRARSLVDARIDAPADRSINGRLTLGDLRELVHAAERLDRMLRHVGRTCDSSSHATPCDPVEFEDADGVPLCADCYEELRAHWESKPICPACRGSDEDCPRCEGLGRLMHDDEDTADD